MSASSSVAAKSIVTLTVNPALDVSTSTDRVVSEHKLRCGPTRLDPGGGGVNVARVVQRLGGQVLAVAALGGPTGAAYRTLLDQEGVAVRTVPITGSTRESFTVDETSTGEQFRFVLQGPQLTDAEWSACLQALEQSIPRGGYVVASGSLPPGAPTDFYARVARLAREHDARCVVDTSGPALAEALAEGVFLVKPSKRELGDLLGIELTSRESQVEAASALVARGSAELVALTLGGAGAVLASAAGVSRLPVPQVTVRSTVGAGDSFLGGFLVRLAQGWSPEEAFRTAVAAGSAAAMSIATGLCQPEDVSRLEAELASIS